MHQIRLIPVVTAVLVFTAPSPSPAQATTVATVVGARLDSTFQAAAARGFSGVVRVEKDGVVLVRKGYGLANREQHIPFTPATVVQIGSNTKDFTLLALLRLQSRGKLSLNDTLGKYFPATPPDKRTITLRQLVDHTAGFPIGFGGDFEAVTRAQFVERALRSPLRAKPGTHEIYSNAGYALLAAIIEQVTGQSYDQYVRRDILEPLGLRDTGFLLPRLDARRVAHGYEGGKDQGSILERPHATDGPYWNLRGNGGMVSTVEDMHNFYKALFDSDQLIGRSARGDYFPPGEPIGLAGSDLVNFFLYDRDPVQRTEIIVATNSAGFKAPRIREEIAGILGLPSMNREASAVAGPPPNAKPPAPAVAHALAEMFASINSGDTLRVRKFIETTMSMDGPPLPQRVDRFMTMHSRLGHLRVNAVWSGEGNSVNVSVMTAEEGAGTIVMDVVSQSPVRLSNLRVMIGG